MTSLGHVTQGCFHAFNQPCLPTVLTRSVASPHCHCPHRSCGCTMTWYLHAAYLSEFGAAGRVSAHGLMSQGHFGCICSNSQRGAANWRICCSQRRPSTPRLVVVNSCLSCAQGTIVMVVHSKQAGTCCGWHDGGACAAKGM